MTALSATRMAKADAAAAADAARVLAAGGLVAFPTETVYGLGADATNGHAVARLYDAKGRPAFNPLIAHVADLARRRRWRASMPTPSGCRQRLWPGPLTLVLPKAAGCPVAELATAGLDTHRGARARPCGGARRSSRHSASRWWRRPPIAPAMCPRPRPNTCAADLSGRIDLIIDGGATPVGVEFDHRRLPRRAGPAAAGRHAARGDRARAWQNARSPIRLRPRDEERRSRPACSLPTMRRARGCGFNADRVAAGEALLAFGPLPAEGAERAAKRCSISRPAATSIEAAANLFAHLRALDAAGAARHRRHAGPRARGSARRSTTGSRARRRASAPATLRCYLV